jgi:hypothetical protein
MREGERGRVRERKNFLKGELKKWEKEKEREWEGE